MDLSLICTWYINQHSSLSAAAGMFIFIYGGLALGFGVGYFLTGWNLANEQENAYNRREVLFKEVEVLYLTRQTELACRFRRYSSIFVLLLLLFALLPSKETAIAFSQLKEIPVVVIQPEEK